jgi:hypothetical protein
MHAAAWLSQQALVSNTLGTPTHPPTHPHPLALASTVVGDTVTGCAHSPPRCAGSANAEPSPFFYDWAAQLSRISPGSRAAALGAMSEDDRLVVQVGAGGSAWVTRVSV